MNEKERKKLEKELEKLPYEAVVVFAARNALRVFPMLAKHDPVFGYWKKENQACSLLALMQAFQITLLKGAGGQIVVDIDAVVDAAFKASSTIDHAINAVLYAAQTIYSAARVIVADNYLYNYIYGYATYVTKIFEMEVAWQQDLKKLQQGQSILNLPLWPSEIPKDILILWKKMKSAILDLDHNFQIWVDWYEARLFGDTINVKLEEKLVNIPKEIRDQGVTSINEFLEKITAGKVGRPLNQVRAIFMGHGEAGKTSLIHTLFDESVVEGKEKMTPGIEVRKWNVPKDKLKTVAQNNSWLEKLGFGKKQKEQEDPNQVKAHFWDFGGQVMAHATHQFFLRERCLYIIVLNSRDEINANEQAEYWLQHVKAFGGDAKVMLVGNKYDLVPLNLDLHTLKTKYPNVVDFYPLSCTQYNDGAKCQNLFKTFKHDLVLHLSDEKLNREIFTDAQFEIMQELEQKAEKSSFLSKTDFKTICENHDLKDDEQNPQRQKNYLGLLDSLGVVLHFRKIRELDSFVLNPRWLTYGAYTVLYSEIAKEKQGRISRNDVFDILEQNEIEDKQTGQILDYQSDKIGFLIKAMEQFKVCYQIDAENLVFPALLSSDRPKNLPFETENTLQFEFKFEGFLPRHVMPSLIVQFHREIRQENGNEVVWQNGVLLHNENHHAGALLIVDHQDRKLEISVNGVGAKEYLEILLHAAREIIQTMEGLEYREWITLPAEALLSEGIREEVGKVLGLLEKAPYQQIISQARQGVWRYFSPDSGAQYDLRRVLGMVMSNQSLKSQEIQTVPIATSQLISKIEKVESENGRLSTELQELKDLLAEFNKQPQDSQKKGKLKTIVESGSVEYGKAVVKEVGKQTWDQFMELLGKI